MLSKINYLKENYMDENGYSEIIERYKLPKELAYTSGDSPVFRNDSNIGKEYKFFRFSPTLDLDKKKSYCWNMTEEDKKMIEDIHKSLRFPIKLDIDYHGSGSVVYYIQFFGKGNKIVSDTIKSSIKKEIHKLPCANCGSNQNIECDHKNDLKNDIRVLSIETQTIDDFQPLCKHCNDVKRSVKSIMLKSGKRVGATKLGYNMDFTQGTDYLDKYDPNWYIGTYWGDCLAFKKHLFM